MIPIGTPYISVTDCVSVENSDFAPIRHDSDRDPLIGAKSLFSTDTQSVTDTASSKVIRLSGGVCVSRRRTTKCQNDF